MKNFFALTALVLSTPGAMSWTTNFNQPITITSETCRRQILGSVLGVAMAGFTSPANAFDRQTEKFSYSINIPASANQSQKPLKTHQDEINFKSEAMRGYQYGITVDPVRINSLKEFGTPEEVAARVVTAEVNRDGIFEVTLLNDPIQSDGDDAYILEYLSVGKRGKKHCINKIFVKSNELYVLTAQCKEENFDTQKDEMLRTVKSFQV